MDTPCLSLLSMFADIVLFLSAAVGKGETLCSQNTYGKTNVLNVWEKMGVGSFPLQVQNLQVHL